MSESLPRPDLAVVADPASSTHSQESSTADSNATGPYIPHGLTRFPEIPGYRVEGLLGRGGMGVVFKAHHLALKRTVALKVMVPRGDDGRERARFRTEAEAIARLQHPNIVQVFEAGEYAEAPYCALEYVEGGSLSERLAGKPMPPREAARLVESLARGVHLAHSRGIIHRDLKPANVLLTRDGIPKVTDFGLARQLDTDSGQTRAGAIMGTPSYMAPEQAHGETYQAGPAADVWALGAILYECLTGRPPFKGTTVLETLEQVRSMAPPSPRSLTAVPRDLETIALKCLRKEPESRYASAAELADDLVRFSRGEPITARPVGRGERFVKWAFRNPVLAGAGALALAALTATAIVALLYAAEKSESARQKERDNGEIRKALAGEQVANQKVGEALRSSESSRRLAEYRLAEHHWRQGRARAELGQVPEALLWWSRGLAVAPQDATDLHSLLGMELESWWSVASPLQSSFELDGRLEWMQFNSEGILLAEIMGPPFLIPRLWDVGAGRPLGPELVRPAFDLGVTLLDNGRVIAIFPYVDEGEKEKPPRDANLWDLRTGKLICPKLEHEGQVRAVALTKDGSLIVTGCHKGTARTWDDAGKPVSPVMRHEKAVTCVALSPDRRSVLTGSWDTTAKLWDARTGECRHTLKHSLGKFRSDIAKVMFSLDGQTLLTWATEGRLWLWDAATGAQRGESLPHQFWLGENMLDPTGTTILTVPEKNRLQRWDLKTLKPIGPVMELREQLQSAAHSPDGKVLLTGCGQYLRSGEAQLWEVATGKPLGGPMPHPHPVDHVAFSKDGHQFATATSYSEIVDKFRTEVRIWDFAGTAKSVRHNAQGKPLNRLVFRPDGQALLAVSSTEARLLGPDGKPFGQTILHGRQMTAAVSNPASQVLDKMEFLGTTSSPTDAAFHPDGSVLITGGRDGLAIIRDANTGKPTGKVLPHRFHVTCLAFRPDGKLLATGSADRNVRLWDAKTWEPIGKPLTMPSEVKSISWDREGKRLLAATYSKIAILWDIKSGKAVGGPFQTEESIKGGILSPDAKTVFLASGNLVSRKGEIRRWDVAAGQPVGEPLQHENELTAFILSADGTLLASASKDGIVRIWRADNGNPVGLPMAHPKEVSAIAFSPDGKLLLTGAGDGKARFWETEHSRRVGPARDITGSLRTICFTPDGSRYAVASSTGDIAIWPVPRPFAKAPEILQLEAELKFGVELGADEVLRPLTPIQWRSKQNAFQTDPAR